MKALLFVGALAAQDYSVAARDCFAHDGTLRALIREYYVCVMENAQRLEPSEAEPAYIATAAINSCAATYREIGWRLDACQVLFAAAIGDSFAQSARGVVREGAQSTAISTVVELRAARSSGE